MTQKTAQIIFIVFNIIAVFAVGYVVYDFINIIAAIEISQEKIPFDSGTYYVLLMSVFWVMSVIQYLGLKNKKSSILKYANQVLVVWFVLMILLANLIPHYLIDKLESASYIKCDDSKEVSRVTKGESSYYIKGGCV